MTGRMAERVSHQPMPAPIERIHDDTQSVRSSFVEAWFQRSRFDTRVRSDPAILGLCMLSPRFNEVFADAILLYAHCLVEKRSP